MKAQTHKLILNGVEYVRPVSMQRYTNLIQIYCQAHQRFYKKYRFILFFSENLTGRGAKMYAGSAKTRECNFSMEIMEMLELQYDAEGIPWVMRWEWNPK